jgi:hypothetical protein
MMVLSAGTLIAQDVTAESGKKTSELFRKGTYFVGSGALFNNYLGASEEVWSLSVSGQTGYFHRD